tara:strand:+ start:483 stop:758 length:276 start_codon:yes stop_codon:yes gene_type:complete
MNVIKVLGLVTNVNVGLGSSVPDQNNLGAQYAMIQHDHSSARVIEVRTADGSLYGSFHMAGKEPIIIKKERTDLIYSDHSDVYATSIVYQG